jgi:outer membrane protein TolC
MQSKIVVILSSLLLLIPLFSFPAYGGTKGEILTLEAAQAVALENNPTLQILQLEYEEKGYAVSVAGNALEDTRREIRDLNYGLQELARRERDVWGDLDSEEVDEVYKPIYRQELRLISQHASGLEEAIDRMAETRSVLGYQYELGKATRDEVRQRLENEKAVLAREVEAKYYAIPQLDRTYKNLEETQDYLLKKQRAENIRLSLGLSTPLAVQAIGAEVENTGYLLRTTATLRHWARQHFNSLLGRSLDSPLFLEEKISPKEEHVPHPGPETIFLEKSEGLKSLRASIEVENSRAADLKDLYSAGTPEYLETTKKLEKLHLELEKAKHDLHMEINDAYDRVWEAKANLRSREMEYDLARERLHMGKLKKDLGLISALELQKLNNQTRQAETRLYESTAAYNLAVTDYDLAREGVIIPRGAGISTMVMPS